MSTLHKTTPSSPTVPKSLPQIPLFRAIRDIPRILEHPPRVIARNVAQFGHIYSASMLFNLSKKRAQIIVTDEPNYIQHVLQKNNKNYRKTEIQTERLAKYIGKGLLTSEGDYWLQQRRLIQPGFHRKKLQGLGTIMLEEIKTYEQKLAAVQAKGEAIDVFKFMMEIAFSIVSKSIFSRGVDQSELKRVDFIITEVQKHFIKTVRQPFRMPWYRLTGKQKYYEQLGEEADNIMLKNIQERIDSGEEYDDLLDMLLKVRYEDTGEGMSVQQLKDEAVILFVAGHETSANALAWMWYLLSQHPDIEQKVLDEVNTVLGDRDVTFADLPQLTYVKKVVNETMRLYPPAWGTDRYALEDDVIDGYHIPKNSVMLLSIYGAHRHPDYWENPMEFNPDNFDKEKMAKRPKYAFMPFGGGPRLCIGNNFALMELQMVLAQFIRKFRFELVPNQVIEEEPLVTLRPKYGIQMVVKKRGDN